MEMLELTKAYARNFLGGKLTYLAGLLGIIYGVVGFFAELHDAQTAMVFVNANLAVIGFRRAMEPVVTEEAR